jgi:hypothetical protein
MVQALVSAKTQTVKEIKDYTKKKKRKKLILKLVFIIIIVFLIALVLNRIIIETRYSYTDKETEIFLKSENFHLKEGFEVFSTDQNYVVVFNSLYDDQNYLSSITEGIVFIQSILFAKNKNVVLVISLVDKDNTLISCQSNLGNIYENIELTREECLEVINKDVSTIVVQYPMYEDTKILLNVSEKLLVIEPKEKKDVFPALSLAVDHMFSDSRLIREVILDVEKNLDVN